MSPSAGMRVHPAVIFITERNGLGCWEITASNGGRSAMIGDGPSPIPHNPISCDASRPTTAQSVNWMMALSIRFRYKRCNKCNKRPCWQIIKANKNGRNCFCFFFLFLFLFLSARLMDCEADSSDDGSGGSGLRLPFVLVDGHRGYGVVPTQDGRGAPTKRISIYRRRFRDEREPRAREDEPPRLANGTRVIYPFRSVVFVTVFAVLLLRVASPTALISPIQRQSRRHCALSFIFFDPWPPLAREKGGGEQVRSSKKRRKTRERDKRI